LNSALRLLQIRPRSTYEITTRLSKYTSDQDLINRVLNQLKSAHFLDDDKFAQWLVESRSRSRPRGKRLLIQELKSKGIDASDYELTDIDEASLALQALQKKQKSWSGLSSKSYQLKAKSYLYARGFPWGVIETAVKKGYNSIHVS